MAERRIAIQQYSDNDVAKELEPVYNCSIFCRRAGVQESDFGRARQQEPGSCVQSIEYTSGIHYKKDGEQVLLFINSVNQELNCDSLLYSYKQSLISNSGQYRKKGLVLSGLKGI